MTQLYLIRHADYIYDRVDGKGPQRDLGLSLEGRAQALALKARLAAQREALKPEVFLCSTERRARETAEIAAGALGLPVQHDRDLEEWRSDDGTIETDAFMATWRGLPERQRAFHRFVDGCETGIEFMARAHSALHRIVTQHAGRSVVVMTHGGVVQSSFQFFFGFGDAALRRAAPAVGHTSITHWRHDAASSRWVLEFANDTHHLRQHIEGSA